MRDFKQFPIRHAHFFHRFTSSCAPSSNPHRCPIWTLSERSTTHQLRHFIMFLLFLELVNLTWKNNQICFRLLHSAASCPKRKINNQQRVINVSAFCKMEDFTVDFFLLLHPQHERMRSMGNGSVPLHVEGSPYPPTPWRFHPLSFSIFHQTKMALMKNIKLGAEWKLN